MAAEFREFQIFVKPVGAQCNLNCSYCYYHEKMDIEVTVPGGIMSDEVPERYIRQHIEASTEPEIFFSWHGGEPILAGLDFFRRAVTFQKALMPADRTIPSAFSGLSAAVFLPWR